MNLVLRYFHGHADLRWLPHTHGLKDLGRTSLAGVSTAKLAVCGIGVERYQVRWIYVLERSQNGQDDLEVFLALRH